MVIRLRGAIAGGQLGEENKKPHDGAGASGSVYGCQMSDTELMDIGSANSIPF
jgi:hypothetical protein